MAKINPIVEEGEQDLSKRRDVFPFLDVLLVNEPSEFDYEYERFLDSIKTSLFFIKLPSIQPIESNPERLSIQGTLRFNGLSNRGSQLRQVSS